MGGVHHPSFVPGMGTDCCVTLGNCLTPLSLHLLPSGPKTLFAYLKGSCGQQERMMCWESGQTWSIY